MAISTDYTQLIGMNTTTAVGQADEIEAVSTADDFLTMLVAEIQNQDPLEPMDNAEYIAQLTQFQTLDAINALRDDINEMKSIDMIGKEVATGIDNGTIIKGIVQSIFKDGDTIMLDLGDYSVKLEDVMAIKEEQKNDDINNEILNELKNITNAISEVKESQEAKVIEVYKTNEVTEENKEDEELEGVQ